MPEREGRAVDDFPQRRSLEIFARDLLYLIKAASIYPGGHPTVNAVTDRLTAWKPVAGFPMRLGVSRTELVLDGRFYGGKRSRICALAGFLHSRRVKSLTLKPGITAAHYNLFAGMLASRTIEGGQMLADALSAVGIVSIAMEPLDIAHVHDTLSCDGKSKALDGKERGQQVWLWLQAEQTRPEEVAGALGSEDFWNLASAGPEGALEMGYLLSGLGQRLSQGLGLLPPAQREQVLKRLQEVGRRVSPGQLADILARCPDPALMQRDGMLALVGDLEGDKLIDLMAGVVSADGAPSDRFQALFRQLAPAGGEEEALRAVQQRILTGDHRGFSVEVWNNLESFLLERCDTPYVGEEYRDSLESMAGSRLEGRNYRIPLNFAEDSESHLDLVYAGLAVAGGGAWREPWWNLYERIRLRCAQGGLEPALALAETVDTVAPRALDSEANLLCGLLSAACDSARTLDPLLRRRFGRFARLHGEILLEPMLAALRDAPRVSTRRLLVELLAGLGVETTPVIVSRARIGPWYLTRNLVIALGMRGDPGALPFLATLLGHEESRVRRHALRALARFEEKGYPAVEEFLADPSREPRDRQLARKLLRRGQPA